MNEHIEVVKKWLEDPDSVSQKELSYSSNSTMLGYSEAATLYDAAFDALGAAEEALEAAAVPFELAAQEATNDYDAAQAAAKAATLLMYATEAAAEGNDDAAYWVKRYEDLSK
tara:strand:- start:514 stop:852 length:339 start_codon:yes stop_codon:yes gene_type:complete